MKKKTRRFYSSCLVVFHFHPLQNYSLSSVSLISLPPSVLSKLGVNDYLTTITSHVHDFNCYFK